MLSTLLLLLIAAGNRALDRGNPQEAALDFAQALEAATRAGASPASLVHLRVTLATAYMEAGRPRDAEAALQAQGATTGISHAELRNAWSALHLKVGRISEAEAELQDAWRIVGESAQAGPLPATVLHNLAAVEMRTGRYTEALHHEQHALRRFQAVLAADHPTLIRAWASLASVQYMAGQAAEARVSIEHALASAEKTYGPDHPMIADLLESDAVVLDKLKLKKSAREARERTRKIRGRPAPAGQDAMTRSVKELAAAPNQVYLRSK